MMMMTMLLILTVKESFLKMMLEIVTEISKKGVVLVILKLKLITMTTGVAVMMMTD
jgi:hypothetical protein